MLQSSLVVVVTGEGRGLIAGALTRCRPASSCKWLCHVYLQMRGEVAEWPKAAVC